MVLLLQIRPQGLVFIFSASQSLIDGFSFLVNFKHSKFDAFSVVKSDHSVQISICVHLAVVDRLESEPGLLPDGFERADSSIGALEGSLGQGRLSVVPRIDV